MSYRSGTAVGSVGMWKRYRQFLRRSPELTLTWHDRETNARAWLVINSMRGGAAGGGTRMRAGCEPFEVVYLAKAMELKFSISGPPIGGAKTGIDFDHTDPRKTRVLERWYRAVTPFLRDRYGTGGDLGIDEIADVIPAFERLGLHHPQEGVVRGHLRPDAATFQQIIRRLDTGVAAPVDNAPSNFTVADVVTGYGVGQAVERLYQQREQSLDGVRVLLEGFGNVGAACALYLARKGARIVGISDARGWLSDPAGVDGHGIEELITRRQNKLLPPDDARVRRGFDGFFATQADVFVCAAISGSITADTLDVMEANGVKVIACGANQPFRESKLGSTRIARTADRRFAVLPDILSNCGMARTFSYLMESNAQTSASPIVGAVKSTITETLDEVIDRAASTEFGLLAATLGLALDRVGAD